MNLIYQSEFVFLKLNETGGKGHSGEKGREKDTVAVKRGRGTVGNRVWKGVNWLRNGGVGHSG